MQQLRSNVTITKNPETGNVFTENEGVSENDGKQYGFIRLQQEIVDMSGGVGSVKVRSALKSFEKSTFEKASKILVEGRELPGNIVREETTEGTELFGEGLGWKEKRAGSAEDAPVCKIGNKTIYQRSRYDETGEEADILIPHTNKEEIKAYQENLKGSAVINK